jgi:hypothetical protein
MADKPITSFQEPDLFSFGNRVNQPQISEVSPNEVLILPCGSAKDPASCGMEAFKRYTGPMWKEARKAMGGPENVMKYLKDAGVDVKIISAKFGMMDADKFIGNYDQQLTPERLAEIKADKTLTQTIQETLAKYDPEKVRLGTPKNYTDLITDVMGREYKSVFEKGSGSGLQKKGIVDYLKSKAPPVEDFAGAPVLIPGKTPTAASPIPASHRLPAPSSAVPQLPPPASAASRIPAWAKTGLGRLNPWANFMQLYLQGLGQLPPGTRETPAASGSQLPENVSKGIQAFKERMLVPAGGIAQLPGRHRAYHGTVSGKGQFPLAETELDLAHKTEYVTPRYGDEQLNRLLGPHFSKTPDIANRFAEGLYQWRSVSGDSSPLEGQVIPADISTRLKKIYQPLRPYTGRSGEKVWKSALGDAEAISNDMFNVVFSDPRNKELFLDITDLWGAEPRHKVSLAYDSVVDGTFSLLKETDRPLNTKGIDTDKPQLMGRFVREILGTDLLYANTDQRKRVVEEYKRILGEQGFEGIEYENTAPQEIEGLGEDREARRSFVVFDPFTGARSPFALKGKNWARGGFVDKPLYEERRMLW